MHAVAVVLHDGDLCPLVSVLPTALWKLSHTQQCIWWNDRMMYVCRLETVEK